MSLAGARSVNIENDAPKGRSSGEITGVLHSLGHEMYSFTVLKRQQRRGFVGKCTEWGPNCTVHGV